MRTAICSIVKNEHRRIEEWIRYHLQLGFDDIWVGEDYDSKSHSDITDKFASVHLVKLSDIMPGISPATTRQVKWYERFRQDHKDDYDWISNLDIDEYIEIEIGTLIDYLSLFDGTKGVVMAWKYYNACGRISSPDGTLLDSYPYPSYDIPADCQAKSIYNPKLVQSVGTCHIPEFGLLKAWDMKPYTQTEYGSLFGWALSTDRSHFAGAWVRHYFTQSWEDWLVRMLRGNMNNNYRTLDTFFRYNPELESRDLELIRKALADHHIFSTANILSRKYSIYNEKYVKKLKLEFANKFIRHV